MIHVARCTTIAIGICIGIPYVLALIGVAKVADRYYQQRAR